MFHNNQAYVRPNEEGVIKEKALPGAVLSFSIYLLSQKVLFWFQ